MTNPHLMLSSVATAGWLEERFQNVYKKDPTYKEGGAPVVNLELDQV